MTNKSIEVTKQLVNLLAKNAILRDEMQINQSISNNEINSVTEQLGSAVQMIYESDMEVIG